MTAPDARLPGGFDGGAHLVGGTVRRTSGPWTGSVHLLLQHLVAAGFEGAPRPLGCDDHGRECLTYLPGRTVGSILPWPTWTHTDEALVQVAQWLRRYHRAVGDFAPPADAVWGAAGLVGFVDWDMAGPMAREADLAWMAFSWVPLHARRVVTSEGFSAFSQRRVRLETFLTEYGWEGTVGEVFGLVADRLTDQLRTMRRTARAGDLTYRRMLDVGRARDLETALTEFGEL